ncbi:hypothetical protein BN159_6027 [Streptomyces davaonensis JCM 4913]|uniref:DUF2330 domain-containing protein n=1 Tax=Streptomyces davaonensis (strain DSM 101723 / JCM 4913 / KCC S-0913 / 768) TaxID=1214101 RepID=K4R2B7_STRDJ|nr:DUF2330 domain-containing protein [Streptomyces davaonensis]CCK30406.1 hypothetical protein BN159_6027 [Streptomyces davaonensis JCM 4913]
MGFLRVRARARVAAVALALLATQIGTLIAPAYACGCGAMIPDEGAQVAVDREESLVRWDGRQEQIVMRLTVEGDAERAAWIMPVPSRAIVRLGDPTLFDALHSVTAPVTRYRDHFWPQDEDWPLDGDEGDGAGAAPEAGEPVGVVGRQQLGPFDVARLTATDPGALDGWLDANGFDLPPRLESALEPYVERRWEYVAVRLAPKSTGAPLGGDLDPLHLSFAATEPVYPMRLSRLARTPQSLGLYVLAGHRMEPASRIGGERPQVTYAGRVNARSGPLAELAAGTPYLTAIGQEFPRPESISADHLLRAAPTDDPFQQVIYEDRLMTVAGIPAWLLAVGGSLLVAAAAVSVFLVRRSRRPAGDYIP